MKRKWITALLTSAILFGITGCGTPNAPKDEQNITAQEGQAASETAEESAGATVNVYVSTDLESSLDKEIEAYKEVKPDVEIVKHVIANDDYDDKMKVLLSGGAKDVDVFWGRVPAHVNNYQAVGALEDLAPYAAASGVDLGPVKDTALSVVSVGDAFYGLPIYSSCWMLFYNKALFDEANVPYPTEQMTWDEYCELAESLTHKDGDTQYYGGQCPNWTMNLGAIAAGEYLTDPEPLEKTRAYLEITNRMYSKSHVSIEDMSNSSWDNNASFANGNVYMMILGDWGYRDLDCPFEYGTAPLPVMDGVEPGSSVGNACYLCMSQNAADKQAAYDFMEFYTTSDIGTSITASSGNIPSYATDAAMKAYQESVKIDGIENRFAARVLAEQTSDTDYAQLYEAFKQEAQLYLLGEESIDDCMQKYFNMRKEIKNR